jgi:hypothetical protein
MARTKQNWPQQRDLPVTTPMVPTTPTGLDAPSPPATTPTVPSSHFFYDSAAGIELGSSPEPINMLVLGPKGSGKEALLANLRNANVDTTDLFASPERTATAAAAVKELGLAHLRWNVNVDNVRIKAFHASARKSLLLLRHRRRLKAYLASGKTEDGATVPYTNPQGQGRVRGVLFLVNLYAGLDEALEARRSLLDIEDLRGLPFAVLVHRLDDDGGEGPKVSEAEDAKMLGWFESMWMDAGPWEWPWKVFIGSVKERRGYLEAFRWIMRTEPWG